MALPWFTTVHDTGTVAPVAARLGAEGEVTARSAPATAIGTANTSFVSWPLSLSP